MSAKHNQRSREDILAKRYHNRQVVRWLIEPRDSKGGVVMPRWWLQQTAASIQVHNTSWRTYVKQTRYLV